MTDEQAINIYFGVTIFIQVLGVGYNLAKHGQMKEPKPYSAFGVSVVLVMLILFAYHYATLFK